jgi:hypothetical protein
MAVWKTLLLVYRELAVKLGRGKRFHHLLGEDEIADALDSFRGFPRLVEELTSDAARIDSEIVEIERALSSLTRRGQKEWWPSPDDTRPELDRFAPDGKFDSVFVLWPQHDFEHGISVPGYAWGLGMGASDWSNGATYAAIANAPSANWKNEARGEVWLHEWLHGVCHHFAQRGHVMPERDADGAELHGYKGSAARGWCDYYRDLMTGNVAENCLRVGIPPTWGSGCFSEHICDGCRHIRANSATAVRPPAFPPLYRRTCQRHPFHHRSS